MSGAALRVVACVRVVLTAGGDAGTSSGINFLNEDSRTVSLLARAGTGVVRSNFLGELVRNARARSGLTARLRSAVPNTLPAYYFEVTVTSLGPLQVPRAP